MAKCNNEACGFTSPKALETCPRCGGPLSGGKKDRPVGDTAPPATSEDGTPPPPAAPSRKKPSKKSRHK
jgi:hypothetical protein